MCHNYYAIKQAGASTQPHSAPSLKMSAGFHSGLKRSGSLPKMHHFKLIDKILDSKRVHLIERCNYKVLEAKGLINFADFLLTELPSVPFFISDQGWSCVSETETKEKQETCLCFLGAQTAPVYSPTWNPLVNFPGKASSFLNGNVWNISIQFQFCGKELLAPKRQILKSYPGPYALGWAGGLA